MSNVIYKKDAIKELKKYRDEQSSNPDPDHHISIINDCIDIIKNLPKVSLKDAAKDMGYSLIRIVKREELIAVNNALRDENEKLKAELQAERNLRKYDELYYMGGEVDAEFE